MIVIWFVISKCDLKLVNQINEASEYSLGADFCAYGNEASGFIEDQEYIYTLSDHQLLIKKNSASCLLSHMKNKHFNLIYNTFLPFLGSLFLKTEKIRDASAGCKIFLLEIGTESLGGTVRGTGFGRDCGLLVRQTLE